METVERARHGCLLINPTPPSLNSSPAHLPSSISTKTTSLPSLSHKVLLRKRAWLLTHTIDTSAAPTLSPTSNLVSATLVFAQEEAGTAVCISPNGLILTCAHCVAESEHELDWDKQHWLLFSSGQLVSAVALAWDPKRDLALLLITKTTPASASPGAGSISTPRFPYLSISDSPPRVSSTLLCTGHPGSEDLESDSPTTTPTGYDVLVLSAGTFRGVKKDQDPEDNADIGALMHTCWTYWGHSGAPLAVVRGPIVLRRSRRGAAAVDADAEVGSHGQVMLAGLHSSWDDRTGMRRGVPWEAVVKFLDEFQKRAGDVPEGWRWFFRAEN